MQNKLLKVFFCSILLSIFSSCSKEVENTAETFISPGINCILNNTNDTCKMWVSFSAAVTGDEPIPKIEDAIVEIFEDGRALAPLTFDTASGLYLLPNFTFSAEKQYSCKVGVRNYPEIYAQTEIPAITPVSNVKALPIAGIDAMNAITYGSVTFTFKNQVNKKQYFEAMIYTVSRYPANQPDLRSVVCKDFNTNETDPVLLHEGLPLLLFSNKLIKDTSYTMTLYFYNHNSKERIYFEFRTVSESYYHFARSLYLYNKGRFPYLFETAPPSQLYSNVQNAWGIFAGYASYSAGYFGEWDEYAK